MILDDEGKEISSKSFHLGKYILTIIKKGFNLINVKLDWVEVQKYIDCSEEISEQIDITYIIRKLMFMDAAMLKIL